MLQVLSVSTPPNVIAFRMDGLDIRSLLQLQRAHWAEAGGRGVIRAGVSLGAQVQSLTPPKQFGPLKGGWGVGGWDHTNRYCVPVLSFEGGIFNEQQTTFVPICPHGGERSMWPQNQKWPHKSCPLGGPGKMPRKN